MSSGANDQRDFQQWPCHCQKKKIDWVSQQQILKSFLSKRTGALEQKIESKAKSYNFCNQSIDSPSGATKLIATHAFSGLTLKWIV